MPSVVPPSVPVPGIEPAPAGERPRHDLDAVRLGITHDLAVAREFSGVARTSGTSTNRTFPGIDGLR